MRSSKPEFDAEEQALAGVLAARKQGCPPLDVLMAMGQEVLPEDVEKAARAHVAACGLCAGLIADMATLPEAEMTAAERERVAAKLPGSAVVAKKRASVRGWIGIAAVLVLGVGGLVALRGHRAEQAKVVESTPAVAAPSAVAELSIPLTPLAPPEDAAIVTRGGRAGGEPATGELLPAFTAYNHADYAGAGRAFEGLAKRYPKSGVVALYLGVSELYLGKDREAQEALRVAAARDDAGKNAALWYGAIAANRLHSAETKALLRQLCDGHDAVYSARSCGLL